MLIGILVLAASMATSDGEEVERLLSRNESILAKVRTLRATLEVKQSEDAGKTWISLETSQIIRSGRKELVRTKSAGAFLRDVWRPSETETVDLYDLAEVRTLGLSPRVSGSLNAPVSDSPGGWINQWKAQAMLTPGMLSFRGVVEKGRVQSVRPDPDGRGVTVMVDVIADAKSPSPFRAYKLTFSPRNSYYVTKQVIGFVDEANTAQSSTREVVDFWELGSGIVLAKTIRSRQSRKPQTILQFELRDVICNEPIGDEEFQLPFPKDAIIVDNRTGTYHIWGKDEPARTFDSTDQFNDWQMEQAQAKRKATRSGLSGWLWVALAAVVALVPLILYRRRLARVA